MSLSPRLNCPISSVFRSLVIVICYRKFSSSAGTSRFFRSTILPPCLLELLPTLLLLSTHNKDVSVPFRQGNATGNRHNIATKSISTSIPPRGGYRRPACHPPPPISSPSLLVRKWCPSVVTTWPSRPRLGGGCPRFHRRGQPCHKPCSPLAATDHLLINHLSHTAFSELPLRPPGRSTTIPPSCRRPVGECCHATVPPCAKASRAAGPVDPGAVGSGRLQPESHGAARAGPEESAGAACMTRQNEQLQGRTNTLDRDNQELGTMLAQSRQRPRYRG